MRLLGGARPDRNARGTDRARASRKATPHAEPLEARWLLASAVNGAWLHSMRAFPSIMAGAEGNAGVARRAHGSTATTHPATLATIGPALPIRTQVARTDYAFATLDVPDSVFTSASGINNAGEVVGFYQVTDRKSVV